VGTGLLLALFLAESLRVRLFCVPFLAQTLEVLQEFPKINVAATVAVQICHDPVELLP
jgi:hypothetical protein